jgi:sugar-specific transcriptional regulator TrmB
MENKLLKSLISYGLTHNEAKIYLVLLKKIEAPVFEIAKETAIPRATVYITLEKMKEATLVSSLKKNNVLYYTPESTNRLKALLLEKQKTLEEILPELNALVNTDKEKPNTRIYIGEEGIKIVLDDILETMQQEKLHTLLAASHSEIMRYFPKYFPNWLKRRETLGIRSKLILPEKERADHIFEPNTLRETRFLPDRFPYEATIEIYGKKIAVFSLKDGEMYSIIIESRPAVEIVTQFFLFAWEHANQ